MGKESEYLFAHNVTTVGHKIISIKDKEKLLQNMEHKFVTKNIKITVINSNGDHTIWRKENR
jgi:hypothetical protein